MKIEWIVKCGICDLHLDKLMVDVRHAERWAAQENPNRCIVCGYDKEA